MMSFTIINGYAVLSLILAANVSLDVLIITSGLPSLSFLSLAFFLPESPVWLMKKGYVEEAKKSLLNLRGTKYEMEVEINELENLVKSQDHSKWTEKLHDLKSRNNVYPFLVMVIIFGLQVMYKCKNLQSFFCIRL